MGGAGLLRCGIAAGSAQLRSQAGVALHTVFHMHYFALTRMLYFRIIGLSDGLTVPFALTAGLSSLGESKLVVLGGVAELIAGAISMGVGGFRA